MWCVFVNCCWCFGGSAERRPVRLRTGRTARGRAGLNDRTNGAAGRALPDPRATGSRPPPCNTYTFKRQQERGTAGRLVRGGSQGARCSMRNGALRAAGARPARVLISPRERAVVCATARFAPLERAPRAIMRRDKGDVSAGRGCRVGRDGVSVGFC